VASPGENIESIVARRTTRRVEGGVETLTRLVPGGPAAADGTGPRSAPGAFDLLLRDPVRPGDRVSLTRGSSWLGPAVVAGEAVTTSVRIEARDRVAGEAPAGSLLSIALRGPEGELEKATAVADASGSWRHELEQARLGPGWWASATVELGAGLWQQAVTVEPRVRLDLRDAWVDGFGPPGWTASVTVLDAVGTRKGGPWRTAVDLDGRFAAHLLTQVDGRAQATRLAPEDVVVIDFVDGNGQAGDPLIVAAPHMTAVADAQADAVFGTAPPGATLEFRSPALGGASPGSPAAEEYSRTLQAGLDGRWRVDLAGASDLKPPAAGSVTLVRPDQHRVRLAWAAVGMAMVLGQGKIEGNAPPQRAVSLTLHAPDGQALAHGTSRAGVDGRWQGTLRDALDAEVPLREGDELRATIGDEVGLRVRLPKLDGVVHVADDLVAGAAPAGAALRLTVGDASSEVVTATLRVDDAGLFAFDFTSLRDLRFNDRVGLDLSHGDHHVRREVHAPGLRLQLDGARLRGSLEPGVAAEARLEREGVVVARATTTAAADATFTLVLRAAGGRPATVEPGDRVIVSAPQAVAAREVSLVAPRLELATLPEGIVAGIAPVEGRLRLDSNAVYPEAVGGGHSTRPDQSQDGTWQLPPGTVPVAPGTRHTAVFGLPSGHVVERSRVVPIVSVEVGGPRVCGHGEPAARVTASRSPGAASAQGEILADHGVFRLRLLEPEPREGQELAGEARISGGDVVEVVGGGVTATMTVPWLAGEVDWSRGEVLIEGPPGAKVALLTPAGDCRGDGPWRDPGGSRTAKVSAHRLDANGLARALVPSDLRDEAAAGPGLQLVLATSEGHRVFHALRPARAALHSQSPRITGTAPPGTRISAALLTPDAQVRADAAGDTDAAGRFRLELTDGEGEAVAMSAGDRLRLRLGRTGGDEVLLGIEPLSVDRDVLRGWIGIASPEREIDLQLQLRGNRLLRLNRRADDVGRWSLGPGDVPPRAGWTLADVVGLRASVGLAEGHVLLTETEGFADWLTGRLPPSEPRVILPWLESGP
jgi:hypothetical protein